MKRLDGIPLTAPLRTLLDLAPLLPARPLEQAVAEAQALGLVRPPELRAAIQGRPRRAGSARLRAAIGDGGPALTRSEAEERFLALIRRAGLPAPEPNVVVAGHEVDFLWPRHRLVVEVDGYGPHSSRRAFERDRRRDADLVAAGLRVMRVTWRDLTRRPEALLVRLTRALG